MPTGSFRTRAQLIHQVLQHFRLDAEPMMAAILNVGLSVIGGLLQNIVIMQVPGVGEQTTQIVLSRSWQS